MQEFTTPTSSPAGRGVSTEVGIDITLDGHCPEVRVRGEIDLSNADGLRDQLSALAGRGTDVAVDLSGVEFLGVAGLDALCDAARLIAEHGCRLLVRSPPDVTRRVIEVLSLDDLLPIILEAPLPPS